MHVTGSVDLRHGGIDQRKAGASIAPCFKQGLCGWAFLPGDLVVRGFERFGRDVGEIAEDLCVKVAPDQFAEPDGRAFASFFLLLQSQPRQLSD